MRLTHAFVSAQAQSSNSALASKNEWNADHKVLYNISAKTANYTPSVDANGVVVDDVVVCSGTMTLTLPAATGSGKPLFVIMSAAGTLTVARTGSDTIGGTTGFAVSAAPACFFVTDQAAGAWAIFPDLDNAYSLKGNPTNATALAQDVQNIVLGTPAFTPAAVADQFTATSTTYYQGILQNKSNAATASTDYVVENDAGTDTANYADFGINSSAYTGSGSLNLASAGYLYVNGGDLVLGTATNNGIHFVVNGGTTDAMAISSAGIVSIPNLREGLTSTATAAGTTTLTVTSNFYQLFTGTSTQTVQLPVTSTLTLGTSYCILNSSTGAVTVNSSGSNAVAVVPAGGSVTVTCVLITGTTAASWSASGSGAAAAVTTLVATGLITPSTTVGIKGTTAADNAQAGSIGEVITATVATASSVSLTSTTGANVTSISLTAGDWDVWGCVAFTVASTTTVGYLAGGISSSTGALPANNLGVAAIPGAGTNATIDVTLDPTVGIAPIRVNISSTTTYYLVAKAKFGTSTCKAYGTIYARRRR